jgi:hypothetical protein
LIILSSVLFAEEFKGKKLKRLSIAYPNISAAFNQSIRFCLLPTTNSCSSFPLKDDFFFRHNSPTWIDITITIFVIGKNSQD